MTPSPPAVRGPGPLARGERRGWETLPAKLRSALEEQLGARVVRADSRPEGFSPGVAAVLDLDNGERIFAKVVGREANRDSPKLHRAEANVLRRMPTDLPVPRLRGVYDDGDWVALFLEPVPGRPPRLPWVPNELRRVLEALPELQARLTPAPFAAETFAVAHAEAFGNWRHLADTHEAGTDALADLEPWAVRNLARLVELEAELPEGSRGETLLHSDLRADNLLLTDDRVTFVDWPAACRGAGWVDLVLFLPSVSMQGGPKPWEVFDPSPIARGARRDDIDAVLAALAGFLVARGRLPPPPGLSTLRPFQRAQGVEALAWLRRRLSGLAR